MIALSNNRPSVNNPVNPVNTTPVTTPDQPIMHATAKQMLRAHVDQLSMQQQMDFVAAALQLIANRPARNTPFVKG